MHLVICLLDYWLFFFHCFFPRLTFNLAMSVLVWLSTVRHLPAHSEYSHSKLDRRHKMRTLCEQFGNYRVCLPEQTCPARMQLRKINATNFFPEGLRRVPITAWHVRKKTEKPKRIVTVKRGDISGASQSSPSAPNVRSLPLRINVSCAL